MTEQHSTGKPEIGAPAMTINDEHGAAAPGDDFLQKSPAAQDAAMEAALVMMTTTHAPILKFFSFSHLKPELREISRQFAAMAISIADTLPRNAESATALRKLLEAKDAAVRARL